MPREPIPADSTAGPGTDDRRTFLRRLAVVGAGALGAAGSAEAAPPRQLRTSAAKLGRASRANLALKTGVRRLKAPLPKAAPPELQPLSLEKLAEAPTPSTRQRLLNALSASPDGVRVMSDAGLEVATNANIGLSKTLRVMSGSTLAAAYAAGVVLTPTGCAYADGVAAPGKPPIFYQSWAGSLSAETVAACACYVHGMHQVDSEGALWFCFITTPGSETQKLTYLLELSLSSVFTSYLDRLKFSLNFSDFTMSPTSDGTLLAAVELCGTEEAGAAHWFAIHNKRYELGSFGFNWLNVMAM